MASKKLYLTPSTTTYYINGVLIDDMYRVDFRRAINRQPVYGYNSRQFDFVADGKELITGNLIINFRYPGYLRNVIVDGKLRENENAAKLDKKLKGITTDNFSYMDVEELVNNADTALTSEDKAKIIGNMLIGQNHANSDITVGQNRSFTAGKGISASTVPASTTAMVEALRENYFKRFSTPDPGVGPKGNIQSTLSSPLDSRHIENSTFDLTVHYGGQRATFYRVFKECYITGEEETVSASAGAGNDMSSSAQPILEVYPFFCRTIETRTNTNI